MDAPDEDIRLALTILNEAKATYPDRQNTLARLQKRFSLQYLETKDKNLLEVIVNIGQELIKNPVEHPDRFKHLHIHGSALLQRFRVMKSRENLVDAVSYLETAFGNLPETYSSRRELMEDLYTGIHHRYRQLRDLQDLNRAIILGEEVVVAQARVGFTSGRLLSNLANAYEDRYEELSDPSDLAHAICIARDAVNAEADNSDQLAHREQCLGSALYEEFRRSGLVKDLKEAISYYKRAYERSSETDSGRARKLDDLGAGLYNLFQHLGHLVDLNSAIHYWELAVQMTPGDHEERAERVGNLAMGLAERYSRVGASSEAELLRAIEIGRSTISIISPDSPERPGLLDQVADMLHSRYICAWPEKGDLADLEEAIRFWRKSIKLTSKQSRNRAGRCRNFGTGLNTLFHVTNDPTDLEEALRYWKEAVDATPKDHPQLTERIYNLGIGYRNLHRETNEVQYRDKARSCFETSLRDANGIPFERVRAGKRAAKMAIEDSDWLAGAAYLGECLDLLPAIAPPTKSQDDLLHALRQISGLGSLSAFVFLTAGKLAFECLEALEKCRGVIASLTIDLRSDISQLEETHPELSSKYHKIREELSQSAFSTPFENNYSSTDRVVPSLNRMQTMDQLSDVIQEIRTMPGFERFQLAPTQKELHQMAKPGPIVCLNVTEHGCHAFILTTKGLKVIELPKLFLQDIERAIKSSIYNKDAIRNAKLGSKNKQKVEQEAPGSDLTQIMGWLWTAAAEPVLAEVGIPAKDDISAEFPTLWWVGGGLIALLPLHSAGEHQPASTRNTLSHVISSYAPSLKALQFSQAKQESLLDKHGCKVMVVAMHKTEGHPDLNVRDEIAAIKKYVGPSTQVDILEHPSPSAVLHSIPHHSIVHFACHASSDATDPSNSSFYLGSSTIEKLKVSDLRPLSHQLAQVAYLSSCSTAEIGARNLVDESIHLASAFQLVGFRHVIGTLWEANDKAAVIVATAFYKYLLNDKKAVSVAQALHRAVCDLRDAMDKDPNGYTDEYKIRRWAPFIHYGP